MFSIYYFLGHLLKNRCNLRETPSLCDMPWRKSPFAYKNFCGFPNIAMQYSTSWPPYGGELVGLLDSDSYSMPSFVAHIPTGTISLESLPIDIASHIRKEILAVNSETQLPDSHEVYYLIRGRRNNHSKVCLVHGSFFEPKDADELVLRALEQVASDCLNDNDTLAAGHDGVDWLARALAREVLSSRSRSIPKASVSFKLEIMADVIDEVNILNTDRFPEIEDDTLNFVIPDGVDEQFEERMAGLRSSVPIYERRLAKKFVIRHPINGDYFVLSYALQDPFQE